MNIREANEKDIDAWSQMRTVLWPDTTDGHLAVIKEYFDGTSIDIEQAYVASVDGRAIGFLELNIRNFAEGSRQPEVPYVEAWYIEPQAQGKGYGKLLMQRAEQWALSKGYAELASDTEVSNTKSISMHSHLGFVETDRVVCFLKRLAKS